MSEKDVKTELLKAFEYYFYYYFRNQIGIDFFDFSSRRFDSDKNGKIGFWDLKLVVYEIGENLTDEEIQEMIDEADLDHDGEINEHEFLKIIKKTNIY